MLTRTAQLFGAILLGVCLIAQGSGQDSPDANSETLGRRLYVANCAHCHGIDGSGGRGPNLQRPNYERAASDDALQALITDGNPAGEMPANWWLSDAETGLIVGYLRSIGDVPPVALPGNPENGKRIYAEQNCAACHIVNGEGSAFGPELSDVGARRSAAFLQESLLRPDANTPEAFAMVYAVTGEGTPVEGIRLNEDSFTIQLRDVNARFHSFRKSELRAFRKQFGRTPMPAYGEKLSDTEVDDLVAYMASLRGGE